MLFALVVLGGCSSENYEYAELSVVHILTKEDGKIVGIQHFVSWSDEASGSVWKDNDFLAGDKKIDLKERFKVSQIEKIKLLNGAAREGWVVYSHQASERSDVETKDTWQLRRRIQKL